MRTKHSEFMTGRAPETKAGLHHIVLSMKDGLWLCAICCQAKKKLFLIKSLSYLSPCRCSASWSTFARLCTWQLGAPGNLKRA